MSSTSKSAASGEADPEFVAALDDDLNTPKALAVLFDLARNINRSEAPAERSALAARLRASGHLLGLLGADPDAWLQGSKTDGLSAEAVEALLAERLAARKSRDFKAADRIRDELVAAGIVILDGPEGTRWRRTAG
jgi:cysteinyl-tRNA synthetase